MKHPIVLALLAPFLFAAGCSSAPPAMERSSYTQSLDKYYEGRPLCLWQGSVQFPVENPTSGEVHSLGLDALTDSGLLIRKHSHRSYTYVLSPQGRTAFEKDVFSHGAGNFCYGRRQVVSIDNAHASSRSAELVGYHYRIKNPAAWAKNISVQNAFPQIVPELGRVHKAEVTLLNTTDGWEVSGAPAIIPTNENPQRSSALARVKELLGLRNKEQAAM